MSPVLMWDLIVGFISATFILPIIQQPHWSTRARSLVTFVYSVFVGAVLVYLNGGFGQLANFRAVVTSVLLVLVAAISSYKGFAQPTGLAPAIEAVTSPPANR